MIKVETRSDGWFS